MLGCPRLSSLDTVELRKADTWEQHFLPVSPCAEPQPPCDPASSPEIEGRDPLQRSEPVFREGQKRNMRKEESQKGS